jgi:hypothetical protein
MLCTGRRKMEVVEIQAHGRGTRTGTKQANQEKLNLKLNRLASWNNLFLLLGGARERRSTETGARKKIRAICCILSVIALCETREREIIKDGRQMNRAGREKEGLTGRLCIFCLRGACFLFLNEDVLDFKMGWVG